MSKANTRTIWTEEDYKFLKENYLNMSYSQIGSKINKTKSAVQNKLKILGLRKPEKYTYNHSFFKIIDNERKAYWLGFLYADGYVSKTKNGYCCGIEIKHTDADHLRKFNKDIDGNIEVEIRERKDSRIGTFSVARIRLFSKDIFEDLEKLGCIQNKTDKIEMPKIEEKFIWPFLRGFFDGDGCIILNKQRSTMKFDFCSSSLVMLEQIRDFLYKNGIFSYIGKSTSSNGAITRKIPNYRLYISGMENGYIFGSLLYKDATIYLERKKERFDDIVKGYDIVERINTRGHHGGPKHKITK